MCHLNTQLDDKDSHIAQMEEKHVEEMVELTSKLDRQKDLVHEEKQRRRRAVWDSTDIKAQCREHVKAMDLWLMDMATELKVSVDMY